MRRKRYRKKKIKRERGPGIPYIYKNRVYLGKRPQTGTGAISKVKAGLLENVGDVIGL